MFGFAAAMDAAALESEFKFYAALDEIAALAAVRARELASFSKTIPASIRTRKFPAPGVAAGGVLAPSAPAFEHRGTPGWFMHPVFGREDVPWVSQAAHPFLGPAVKETEDAAVLLLEKKVGGVFNKLRF